MRDDVVSVHGRRCVPGVDAVLRDRHQLLGAVHRLLAGCCGVEVSQAAEFSSGGLHAL